jgi:tripartite-type tricarboxylate transporter receptor subunit TctC
MRTLLAAIALAIASPGSAIAEAYPSRPITIIVPLQQAVEPM